MIKSFCNLCELPAAAPSRRLEKLRDGYGLQCVLISDEDESHICDNCIAGLLLAAARGYSKAPEIVALDTALTDSQTYAELKKAFEKDSLKLAEDRRKLDIAVKDLESKRKALEAKAAEDAKAIALLTVQLGNARTQAETRIKQIVAQREQAAVEDPEYVAAVNKREAKRAGALR